MNHPDPTNPFAYRRQRRFEGWRWLIGLPMAIAVAYFAVPAASTQWLLSQLTSEFNQLPSTTQAERIAQIGQLGEAGIPILVKTLTHEETSVAQASYLVLSEQQKLSVEKGIEPGIAYHQRFTEELSLVIEEIPDYRYGWIRTLLNQTLVDTLDSSTQRGSRAYREASVLLARISIDNPNSSISPAADPVTPLQLATASRLTEAAPDQASQLQNLGAPDPRVLEDVGDRWVDPSQPGLATGVSIAESQSLEPAMLTDEGTVETSMIASDAGLPIGGPAPILSAGSYPTRRPLEAYATRAVIDLLGSVREPLAQTARNELMQRGLSSAELVLANRLGSSNASVRMGLVDELPHRTDVNPRTWLLWLAEDGERSVRLQALAALGTMDDPNVTKQLRELLVTEQDPAVAAKIRQALIR